MLKPHAVNAQELWCGVAHVLYIVRGLCGCSCAWLVCSWAVFVHGLCACSHVQAAHVRNWPAFMGYLELLS